MTPACNKVHLNLVVYVLVFCEDGVVVKHFAVACRLAEKYKESQASKETIQKSIEVKKEHLSSLQPGLNAIMQV